MFPAATLCPTRPAVTRDVSVWEFDPTYWRIVWNDADGQPLGLITFERRVVPTVAPSPPRIRWSSLLPSWPIFTRRAAVLGT